MARLTITVKNALPRKPDGGCAVAISDRDDAYEGGELFIGDDKVHEVPATTGVKMAITEGRLIEVDGDEDDEVEVDDDQAAFDQFVAENTVESLREIAANKGVDIPKTVTKKEDIARLILDAE